MNISDSVLITPLAGNDLFFRSLSGREAMGGLFEYDVQVWSKNPKITLADALGKNMTVTVPLSQGGFRYFNGLITRFTRIGLQSNYFLYRAVLHPWSWLLSRTTDCRIFQNRNVPEIAEKIFLKYPEHWFDKKQLAETYKPREFLVQYRETDLNFVNRLLEQEGISSHFVHELGKHTMMLTDSSHGRTAVPNYGQIPLRAATESGMDECFTSWISSQQVSTAAYLLNDFDYLKPKAPLFSPSAITPAPSEGEIYDYPGKFLDTGTGVKLAGVRLDQAQSLHETIEANGTVRGIGVGNIFAIDGPLSIEAKRQFLVVKAHYEIHGRHPDSREQDNSEGFFHCSITAVSCEILFRPARVTPTPVIQGPQTATVVGPNKEDPGANEIWTDDFGRILVRFHWERLGRMKPTDPGRDQEDAEHEMAPVWVRVAQLWAGSGWGTVFIPRIGHEVMVEFLEGDPDRPVVTGRLYNQDNKPAYLVKGDQKPTQSGIRSRSTPKGGPKNFNEIRFDDKIGAEEVYIQAERNQLNKVKHNRTADVGANDTITVGGDRNVEIKGNLSVTVDGGGKSAIHSLQKVTGAHELEATTFIKLHVGETYIEITKSSITLHVDGGGEVIIKTDVEAHSNAKSSLHLDADAKLATDGAATVTGKTLLAHGTDSARIEGKTMTAHADDAARVEGKTTAVHGETEVKVDAGSSITVNKDSIDAKGTTIKLNG